MKDEKDGRTLKTIAPKNEGMKKHIAWFIFFLKKNKTAITLSNRFNFFMKLAR